MWSVFLFPDTSFRVVILSGNQNSSFSLIRIWQHPVLYSCTHSWKGREKGGELQTHPWPLSPGTRMDDHGSGTFKGRGSLSRDWVEGSLDNLAQIMYFSNFWLSVEGYMWVAWCKFQQDRPAQHFLHQPVSINRWPFALGLSVCWRMWGPHHRLSRITLSPDSCIRLSSLRM